MPHVIQTATSAAPFNGTAGRGLVQFQPIPRPDVAEERTKLLSVAFGSTAAAPAAATGVRLELRRGAAATTVTYVLLEDAGPVDSFVWCSGLWVPNDLATTFVLVLICATQGQNASLIVDWQTLRVAG